MCQRKFRPIKYTCRYSYAKFGRFFWVHPVYTAYICVWWNCRQHLAGPQHITYVVTLIRVPFDGLFVILRVSFPSKMHATSELLWHYSMSCFEVCCCRICYVYETVIGLVIRVNKDKTKIVQVKRIAQRQLHWRSCVVWSKMQQFVAYCDHKQGRLKEAVTCTAWSTGWSNERGDRYNNRRQVHYIFQRKNRLSPSFYCVNSIVRRTNQSDADTSAVDTRRSRADD